MRDQIISFLAQGFSKQDVLKATGCSEALYSELIASPSFVSDLSTKKQDLQQEIIEKRYNKLEDTTLKQLQEQAPLMDASQLCRVLDTIARNKIAYRRPAQSYQNPTIHQSVTLLLPEAAVNQKVILDSNSQVVSIGSRVMQSLPLQGVKELFASLETQHAREKEIQNDLEIQIAATDESSPGSEESLQTTGASFYK